MICTVHGAIASHTEYGVAYCVGCFHEAVDVAAPTNVVALIRRLQEERKRRQDADLRAVQRRLEGRK